MTLIPTSFLSKMLYMRSIKCYQESLLCAKIISSYVLQNIISTTVRVDQKFTEVQGQQIIHVLLYDKNSRRKSTNMVRRTNDMFPVIHVLQSCLFRRSYVYSYTQKVMLTIGVTFNISGKRPLYNPLMPSPFRTLIISAVAPLFFKLC